MSTIDVGRGLRWFCGTHEEVLDRAPHERGRYSAMGGVVLAVALLAMISMGVGLHQITGEFHVFMWFLLPVWFLFILCLDRWLVATTTVLDEPCGKRMIRMLPRLAISVVLGVIVAEPLLLAIFHPDVEERVKATRQEEIVARQSRLSRCNQLPGTAGSAAAEREECREVVLVTPGESPEVVQGKLDAAQSQAKRLQATIDRDARTYAALQEKAASECLGVPGRGNTGLRGEGPNCRQRRAETERFRADHRMEENRERLSRMNQQVSSLTENLRAAQSRREAAVKSAIEADRKRLEARQREGLADSFAALHDLAQANSYTAAAQLALRIFLIIVDAAPVLLKILGTRTHYEVMVARRAIQAEETDRQHVAWAEETARRETGLHHRYQQAKAETTHLTKTAELAAQRDQVIADREQRLIRGAFGPLDRLDVEWADFDARRGGDEA
ncbi:DUF4407 domain-containing protein [Nonomuraea sp. NPDC049400]|uniref:DUF4407 domain-containing protein n=1 Tax=Nonomuraea sp. NPDC049400 TaxID=3364352 RepID=UPI0037B2A046